MDKTYLIIALLFIIASCENAEYKSSYYRVSIHEVTCMESQYKDTIYEMGHTTVDIYSVHYENKKGQRVELPNNCVMVELKSNLPIPDSLRLD